MGSSRGSAGLPHEPKLMTLELARSPHLKAESREAPVLWLSAALMEAGFDRSRKTDAGYSSSKRDGLRVHGSPKRLLTKLSECSPSSGAGLTHTRHAAGRGGEDRPRSARLA